MPTPMEEYLFDLHGYTIIKGAIDPDHLRAMNDFLDALPPLQIDQWYGNIDVHTYSGIDGMNLQNIIEGGEIFERLIDHPAWIDLVRHYIGPHDRPFINEGFINIRKQGGYIGVHSGGHMPDSRNRTGRSQGEWCCCLLTLMVPLTNVGVGDGPTVIIPGSHKSDFPHPMQKASAGITHSPGEMIEGTMEVYLKAGDALLFNDCLCHGSAERKNPGERRMIIFRYLPSMYAHRFAYVPSEELLSRLTPEQRAIVQPITPRRPPIK